MEGTQTPSEWSHHSGSLSQVGWPTLTKEFAMPIRLAFLPFLFSASGSAITERESRLCGGHATSIRHTESCKKNKARLFPVDSTTGLHTSELSTFDASMFNWHPGHPDICSPSKVWVEWTNPRWGDTVAMVGYKAAVPTRVNVFCGCNAMPDQSI